MNKQQTVSNHEFKVECKLKRNKWKQSPTFLQNLNWLLKMQNWDHIEAKSHPHVAKFHPHITLQSNNFLIQLIAICMTFGGTTSGGPNGMNLVGMVPQPPLLEPEFGVEVVSQLEHLISKTFSSFWKFNQHLQ